MVQCVCVCVCSLLGRGPVLHLLEDGGSDLGRRLGLAVVHLDKLALGVDQVKEDRVVDEVVGRGGIAVVRRKVHTVRLGDLGNRRLVGAREAHDLWREICTGSAVNHRKDESSVPFK